MGTLHVVALALGCSLVACASTPTSRASEELREGMALERSGAQDAEIGIAWREAIAAGASP
jgi:hypothetical protein